MGAGNSGGESETIIGEWLRRSGRRADVVIATKVGMLDGRRRRGLRPRRIAAAVDESLRRLGTDVIDLYFAHKDDPSVPLADMLGAFDALVREGKVRAIGASNYQRARLAEALDGQRRGRPRALLGGPAATTTCSSATNIEGALQDCGRARGSPASPISASPAAI